MNSLLALIRQRRAELEAQAAQRPRFFQSPIFDVAGDYELGRAAAAEWESAERSAGRIAPNEVPFIRIIVDPRPVDPAIDQAIEARMEAIQATCAAAEGGLPPPRPRGFEGPLDLVAVGGIA